MHTLAEARSPVDRRRCGSAPERRPMSELLSVAAFISHLSACATAYPVTAEVSVERVVATARIESGMHIFAVGDNTDRRSYFFRTQEEAIAKSQELLSKQHRIDAGLMQITDRNWSSYGLTVETVFDARSNICAGARILGEAFAIERRAHCRYNTGRAACTNGYPERVDAAAQVAMGAARLQGQRTPAPQTQDLARAPASDRDGVDNPLDWDVWAQAVQAGRPRLVTAPRNGAPPSHPAGMATLNELARSVE